MEQPRNGVVIKYTGNVNSMNQKGYTKDYIITLDMAKELSMVENNVKGRQARKYFIACEKKLRQQPVALNSIVSQNQQILNQNQQIINQNNKLIQLLNK